MICKGNTHQNGVKLAHYMTTPKEGEHVIRGEMRGFASDDIVKAFRSVHVMAEGTKCEQPFFHAQVRNPEGEKLTRDQWTHVADRIESKLGLTDQPRAIVFHINQETGHEHMHVAWSRIDPETMKAVPLSFFKNRLKEVARELEEELGLTRVRSDRDTPVMAPTRDEVEQARRLGVDVKQVRQTIRDCWEHSDNGMSFRTALAEHDLTIARGDRRAFVVLDHEGGLHALGQRIVGVSAAAVRNRLSDINRDDLPTIAQARVLIAERQPQGQAMPDADLREIAWQDAIAKAAIEKEKVERRFLEPDKDNERTGGRKKDRVAREETAYEIKGQFADASHELAGSPKQQLKGVEKQLWNMYRANHEPEAFAAALENRGMAFACVTPDEAYKSQRQSEFAKAIGRFAPVYHANEIVVVRAPQMEQLRAGEWNELPRVLKLDANHAHKYLEVLGLNKSPLKGIDATKDDLNFWAAQRSSEWEQIRLENSQRINQFAPSVATGVRETIALGKQAGRTAGKALDAVGAAIESVFAPIETPQQKFEGAKETRRRQIGGEERLNLDSMMASFAEERQRQRAEAHLQPHERPVERDR